MLSQLPQPEWHERSYSVIVALLRWLAVTVLLQGSGLRLFVNSPCCMNYITDKPDWRTKDGNMSLQVLKSRQNSSDQQVFFRQYYKQLEAGGFGNAWERYLWSNDELGHRRISIQSKVVWRYRGRYCLHRSCRLIGLCCSRITFPFSLWSYEGARCWKREGLFLKIVLRDAAKDKPLKSLTKRM